MKNNPKNLKIYHKLMNKIIQLCELLEFICQVLFKTSINGKYKLGDSISSLGAVIASIIIYID